MIDAQRRGTILVTEHNNLSEVETPQSINEEAQIIRSRIQQYAFAAFEVFGKTNMHLVVANDRCNSIPSNGYSKISHQSKKDLIY